MPSLYDSALPPQKVDVDNGRGNAYVGDNGKSKRLKNFTKYDQAKIAIDIWLESFENQCQYHEIEYDEYCHNLEPFLTGVGLRAFSQIPKEHKHDYEYVKSKVLRVYQITPETYRQKFNGARKTSDITFEELAGNLGQYLRRWLTLPADMLLKPSIQQLLGKLTANKLLNSIEDDELSFKLKELGCDDLNEMARVGDDWVDQRHHLTVEVISHIRLQVRLVRLRHHLRLVQILLVRLLQQELAVAVVLRSQRKTLLEVW